MNKNILKEINSKVCADIFLKNISKTTEYCMNQYVIDPAIGVRSVFVTDKIIDGKNKVQCTIFKSDNTEKYNIILSVDEWKQIKKELTEKCNNLVN